jgi:heme exporter protein D
MNLLHHTLGFATSWASPWASAADFIAMGGYGLYVWGTFGATALVLGGELLALRARRKALRALDETSAPAHDNHYREAPHEA